MFSLITQTLPNRTPRVWGKYENKNIKTFAFISSDYRCSTSDIRKAKR